MKYVILSCLLLASALNTTAQEQIKAASTQITPSSIENKKEFVEIRQFSATSTQDQVAISWQTTDEKNNSFFSLERSFDLNIWETVSTKQRNSTRVIGSQYSLADLPSKQGSIHYRLKQTDTDGRYSYSDIETVTVEEAAPSGKLVVYPNPTTGLVEVIASKEDLVQFSVRNLNGQDFTNNAVSSFSNNGRLLVDLSSFPAGTYIISTANGKAKVVKQ